MVSSQVESREVGEVGQVGQVERVGHAAAVPVGKGVWDTGLCNSPSPTHPHATHPARRFKKGICPTSTRKATGEWRPAWAMLPDVATLERLSLPGGVPVQQRLWADAQADDTRQGRLARVLALPVVTTADRLPPPDRGGRISGGNGAKTVA